MKGGTGVSQQDGLKVCVWCGGQLRLNIWASESSIDLGSLLGSAT